MGLGIALVPEGGILVRQLVQRGRKLVLVALRLRLDRDRQERIGELDRRKHDRRRAQRQRVAGDRVRQLRERADVAGRYFRRGVLVLAAEGVHLAHALLAVARRVVNGLVRPEGARVDPEERQLADVRVGQRLEHERGERTVRVRRQLDVLPAFGGFHRRAACGGGGLVDDEVGEQVDPDPFRRAPTQHRNRDPGGDGFAQGLGDLFDLDGAALEVSLHEVVVRLDDGLEQLHVEGLFLRRERLGDRVFGPFPIGVGEGAVGEEIHDPRQLVLFADRQMERRHRGAERLDELVERALERGPLTVELVDEERPGDTEVLGDVPGDPGLHLEPLDGGDHDDRQIGRSQPGLRVADEVRVAGRVEQVDLVVLPLERRKGERDRDPLGNLVGIEVADGVAVLDAAHAIDGAGGEQECFGERRFPGTAVADEHDVADPVGGIGLHRPILSFRVRTR